MIILHLLDYLHHTHKHTFVLLLVDNKSAIEHTRQDKTRHIMIIGLNNDRERNSVCFHIKLEYNGCLWIYTAISFHRHQHTWQFRTGFKELYSCREIKTLVCFYFIPFFFLMKNKKNLLLNQNTDILPHHSLTKWEYRPEWNNDSNHMIYKSTMPRTVLWPFFICLRRIDFIFSLSACVDE